MAANNKRGAVRIAKRIEVRYRSQSPPMNGFIEDLSDSGMFVDTTQPLPAGSGVEFSFHLPDASAETPIHGHGIVAWSDRTGMGIEFQQINQQERDRIRFYIASVFFDQVGVSQA